MPQAWTYTLALTEIQSYWRERSNDWRKKCRKYIKWLEKGRAEEKAEEMEALREEINEKCAFLHQWVYQEALGWLDKGKVVGVLGGEHSVPLGLLMALSERYGGRVLAFSKSMPTLICAMLMKGLPTAMPPSCTTLCSFRG